MYLVLVLIIVFAFIIRYVILEYYPNLVVNGYLYLFLLFFLISYFCTRSILYSILLGLATINGRLLYRSFMSPLILDNYNSIQNMTIFMVGLIMLFITIIYYKKIDKILKNYYLFLILSFTIIFLLFLY
jgi:hypothetical protein